ncbi:hypothetical protein GCM10023192_75370 [Amycolatopsis samaneae]
MAVRWMNRAIGGWIRAAPDSSTASPSCPQVYPQLCTELYPGDVRVRRDPNRPDEWLTRDVYRVWATCGIGVGNTVDALWTACECIVDETRVVAAERFVGTVGKVPTAWGNSLVYQRFCVRGEVCFRSRRCFAHVHGRTRVKQREKAYVLAHTAFALTTLDT